jgi:hypothetical protein
MQKTDSRDLSWLLRERRQRRCECACHERKNMSTLHVHLITPTADTTGSTTLEIIGAIKSQDRCATPHKIIRDDYDNSACDAPILVA